MPEDYGSFHLAIDTDILQAGPPVAGHFHFCLAERFRSRSAPDVGRLRVGDLRLGFSADMPTLRAG